MQEKVRRNGWTNLPKTWIVLTCFQGKQEESPPLRQDTQLKHRKKKDIIKLQKEERKALTKVRLQHEKEMDCSIAGMHNGR